MNIRILREKNNISQSQLAELANVSIGTIQKYEKSPEKIKNANAMTVFKIAKALNCKIENLIN